MAGKSLDSMLGYTPLLGVIETTVAGIPNPCPPQMMKRTVECVGDAGEYREVSGERRLASTSTYGSSAKAVPMREIAKRQVKLIHTFEKQPINPMDMQRLMSLNSYEQDRGASVIAHNVKNFAKRGQNLRIATTLMTLANGVIYRDSDGVVLPTTSGEDTNLRISFQVPAANQGQLNDGTTTIISASWALPTTDIPTQMIALEERAARVTGYPIQCAWYGKNIAGYLKKNDFISEWLIRNPDINDSWLKAPGQIPDGLLGIKRWIPCYTTNFRSENDTTINAIWGDDNVTFTPGCETAADLDNWWEWLEGSFLIPNTVDIVAAASSLENFKTEYGMFSYGQMAHDPAGLVNYMGDTFLGALKNGLAIYQADVVP